MKKLIISVLLMVGIVLPTLAQIPLFVYDPRMKKEAINPIKGGEEGKSYAIIIKTDLSKKDLITKTTAFLLQYRLVEEKDLHLDEITEEQSEYTIPFVLPQSFAGISVTMGGKVVYPPAIVFSTLRLEFHDNGNVMIVVDNLSEKSFYTINKMKRSFQFYQDDTAPEMAEFRGHYTAAMMENSFLLKVLIVANKGLDGLNEYKSKIDDYFKDIYSKYDVFKRVEDAGKGAWLSDEEILEFGENSKHAADLDALKQYYDEGRLLAINKKRWEEKIRTTIDMLFRTINLDLSGTIEGVAEDGEQTWINLDGTVVPVDPKWENKTPPTDPKEREKYIKKNKKKQY
jgi:hypothetical protein